MLGTKLPALTWLQRAHTVLFIKRFIRLTAYWFLAELCKTLAPYSPVTCSTHSSTQASATSWGISDQE